MVADAHRAALLLAAAQWRRLGESESFEGVRKVAESTARNLEREAETGIPTCVCCNKAQGQHAGIVR